MKNKIKKFNKKDFEYWNTYSSKSDAENVANTMKTLDNLTRIIKVKNKYVLYLRKGRKIKVKDDHDNEFIPENWETY